MDTSRAFRLCRKIRATTECSVSIKQEIWAFSLGKHQLKYNLCYFTPTGDCEITSFDSWKELEKFAKEKWNV